MQTIRPADALVSLESRTLGDSALAAFLQANQTATAWPPPTWDLNALTLIAFFYNPDLDVARANWSEARAAVITAGGRVNPDATAAPGYNSSTPVSQITPWILTLDLNFTVETAGKRGHRIARAQRISDAARLDIASRAWRVRSHVRQAFLDAYAADLMIAQLDQQLNILQTNVTLLERQLSAGAISPVVVTQMRMARDAARLAIYDARRRRAQASVTLAGALGVSSVALDGVSFSYDEFARPTVPLPPMEVRRQALVSRPDVLAALMAYDASQSELRLELARQYPDIHLGPGYQMDQAEKKWTLSLGGILPVFNRNAGPIAEAVARRAAAAAQFTSVQSRAIEEIDGAMASFRAALSKVALADSMAAERAQQQRAAEAQFSAGDISRLELGILQLELTNVEVSRLEARIALQQAIGGLEDAIQAPAELPAWVIEPPRRHPPGFVDAMREPL